MRIQHILIGCLLFIASFIVLVNISFEVERGYEVSNTDLTNDSNFTEVYNQLNIYNTTQQYLMNASQGAPGQADSDVQDTATTSGAITTASWTTGLKFIGMAITLPKTIIKIVGGFIGVDPVFIQTWLIAITIICIFIIISVPFFNKL